MVAGTMLGRLPIATRPAAIVALEQRLDELLEVLVTIPPALYCAKPAPRVSGSVGEHVRHALDHVSALIVGMPGAALTYDHRERGTEVEADPHAAARRIFRLRAALDEWAAEASLDMPVQVSTRLTTGGEVETAWSTRGRELAFVISHTIHHQAVIAVLLDSLGVTVADRFGYAPSTPRR